MGTIDNITKLKELTKTLNGPPCFESPISINYKCEKGNCSILRIMSIPKIGIMNTQAKKGTQLHWHVQLVNEWLMVYEGEINVLFRDKIVNVKEADYIFIPANIEHTTYAVTDCKVIAITMPKDEGFL